eukprot:COSAG01_NODE_9519_length_2421_cov_30.252369_2_plen_61_part_00
MPQGWPANKPLGSWVNTQRSYRKKFVANPHDPRASITSERIGRLEALGFAWATVERRDDY